MEDCASDEPERIESTTGHLEFLQGLVRLVMLLMIFLVITVDTLSVPLRLAVITMAITVILAVEYYCRRRPVIHVQLFPQLSPTTHELIENPRVPDVFLRRYPSGLCHEYVPDFPLHEDEIFMGIMRRAGPS